MTTKDLLNLREEFVTTYCEKNGWDKFDLTHEQIIEIRNQKEWKNPSLILV